ncbi:hypothetical protein [Rufibacter latericius]|uniref:Lipocalin-like domain-containing protein n=1 Tax=Rufibacter latericius TaxID=2487040 RepID=A0A3M9MVB7_9BACT|nr:hypothetical protein [Rufibacter latericius]RNI29077.1 hypothetical protein EFB08_06505 [Rufibacter latericius]
MRKHCFLPLLFLLALVSCKDEDPVPLSKQILGEWKENRTTSIFFDQANRELYREVHGLNGKYVFGETTFGTYKVTISPNSYYIVRENGKDYLVLENSPVEKYLLKIRGGVMTWSWENYQSQYYDPSTDELKPSVRQSVSVEFIRLE